MRTFPRERFALDDPWHIERFALAVLERVSDAHLLASGTECEPALEAQPMRARVARAVRPAIAAIELSYQREPAMLGCVEVTPRAR
jgi:hypothetical protein